MPSRHAFAYVLVTAMIAIGAAVLHPLLDAQPQGEPGLQGAAGSESGSATQTR